jgi:spore coat protein CotH
MWTATSVFSTNVMLSSFDGFVGGGGHNYYIYLSPKTNQFVFIPWDLTSFGFPMFFTRNSKWI